MSDNATFSRLLEANKRAKAAEAENARLKSRLAVLERAAQLQKENDRPSDAPAIPDAEEDDEASGAWEIGEDGKLRRVKKAVDEKPDEQNEGCDKPKTEEQQEEAAAKARALLVINAWRRSLGLPTIAKLIQDETIPAGLVSPDDSEAFAKCVVASWRKATGRPPLKAGEFISIKRLRGEG